MIAFFQSLTKINIALILLVIIAGSVVRTTQSGMGCPDWPKCYGLIIPPTSVNQLPTNYQELYSNEGIPAEEFNVVKTYIEYINRLLGAILGITVILQGFSSFWLYQKRKSTTILSLIIVLLTGFQGWLGALVVASNLAPIRITLHMSMAMILLLLATHCAYADSQTLIKNTRIRGLIIVSIIMMFLQIVLGTQVREEIDLLAKAFPREIWIDNLSNLFKIHRSYSILILIVNGSFIYLLYKSKELWNTVRYVSIPLTICLLVSALSGIIMAYFSVPQLMQPVHLLCGSVILYLQYRHYLLINKS